MKRNEKPMENKVYLNESKIIIDINRDRKTILTMKHFSYNCYKTDDF